MMVNRDLLAAQLRAIVEPEGAAIAPAVAAGAEGGAEAAAAPPERVRLLDRNACGYELDASLEPHQVLDAAQVLDRAGYALDAVTGVDWIAEEQMEVVYDFFHPHGGPHVALRTRLPRANPEVPTLIPVYPGANWHERETHDFFGIRFVGHPCLKPFLLEDDADYHPLRKDYKP